MIETGDAVPAEPENRAANISVGAAVFAVIVASGSVWGSAGTLYVPLTLGWLVLVELSSLTAIVAGHVARRRAKRQGLGGRWWALGAIVTGWLCALYALLVTLVAVGLVVGLAVLFDHMN
ncbi:MULTISPECIES: DUF4190 domain-containing protein [unclassified Streptomyces]|uniref:DUF4190 domain-containing protein n=1 Tax=unclassified Streptomyces TaxID=2593676 RepID=UPI00296698D9|nr:DUF4190 domain-containing protein [Streptomyces sp. SJL17-1]